MQNYIIIVAGGSGKRMGTETPKQFLLLKGKPVLMHTIERFFQFDSTINCIVVLPDAHIPLWDELCKKHQFTSPHSIVTGGTERFYSVKNGLDILPQDKDVLIGIHDGVRPLVSLQTITECYKTAETYGSAIPTLPPTESIRIVEENTSRILNRDNIRLIQTPQVFKSKSLLSAYNLGFQPSFTDDASVFESAGNSLTLTNGNEGNIKITTPFDLQVAELLIE